ncbi:MAG: cytidine deaminase [Deltaproteobacteria bacterium]|nr:MAG: cytidine deaminase [Deltaproteobacteria bacterium]
MTRKTPHDRLPVLLRAAARARERAYAPYSGFRVGAAVLAEGRIHAAGNMENSSYPLSICAERNAVAMAIAAGARRIDAVAIVGGTKRPAAPCGGCRQVLAEFASPDAPLVYASPDGRSVTTTVGALLPSSFGPDDVMGAAAGSMSTLRGPSGSSRSAARSRGTRSSGRRRSP